MSSTSFPGPSDDAPRYEVVDIVVQHGASATTSTVPAKNDFYSDRLRCDHPSVPASSALAFGEQLIRQAKELKRGRIVVLCRNELASGLLTAGFGIEALMPGFYKGESDCFIMAYFVDSKRAKCLSAPIIAADTARASYFESKQQVADSAELKMPAASSSSEVLLRAGPEDSEQIASLVTASFALYPTPTGVPSVVAADIRSGTPWRVVKDGGRVVSCASGDLTPLALSAELTDCATAASHRGRGHVTLLLRALMHDLVDMGYVSAWSLARAGESSMNIAFARLGFRFCGRMVQSCRIGNGIEDMNCWFRMLPPKQKLRSKL